MNKQHGGAVLTALEARFMSIDEIGKLIPQRRLKAHLKGRDNEEWLDCFWKNLAAMERNGLRGDVPAKCGSDKRCAITESGSSVTECKSRLPRKFKHRGLNRYAINIKRFTT